jgi:ABC-type transport system substrate-binding protein
VNHKISTKIITIVMLASIILAGCNVVDSVDVQLPETYAPLSLEAEDCFYGGQVKSVEALDRDTVRFTLCNPDASFLAKMASPAFSIMDVETLNATQGSSSALSEAANGTGPYVVSRRVAGSELELSINPNYWGTPARMDKLFFIYDDDATRRSAIMRSNLAQAMDSPAARDLVSLQGNNNYNVSIRPSLTLYFLGMNSAIAPFNDQTVRRAFAAALDRQTLVRQYFAPESVTAEQVLPPFIKPGYSESIRWYETQTLESANRLASIGFNFNQEIPLYYVRQANLELIDPEGLVNAIRDQFIEIAVKIVPTPVTATELRTMIDTGQAAFYLTSIKGAYQDASSLMMPLFVDNVKWFGSAYLDLQVGAMGGGRAIDPTSRQERYDSLNQTIYDTAPFIPLTHAASAVVFKSNVENVAVNALMENFEDITTPDRRFAFIQANEPLSLWPGDESDADTLRVNRLLYDTLVRYEFGGTGIVPSLAESWQANDTLTEYTFNLRYNVKFTNGNVLDANDVVASFIAIWDAASPNHIGRTGEFAVFRNSFGGFLNANP